MLYFLTCQFPVSESLSCNSRRNFYKSPCVVALTVVEPESLFVKISVKMGNVNSNISTFDGTFEQTPKVLKAVSGDVTRDRYFLACQVRMADVLDARPYSHAAFHRISSKHFDFVLCDPATTRPLMVIELDDSTHRRADAQARDAFKDAACRAAGLPILRVPVQPGYDPAYLQKRISETIFPSTLDSRAISGV